MFMTVLLDPSYILTDEFEDFRFVTFPTTEVRFR